MWSKFKKFFKDYSEKIVDTIVTNIVWELVVGAVGFVVLNIPKVITEFKNIDNKLSVIATILSVISIILVVVLIVIIVIIIVLRFSKDKTPLDDPTSKGAASEPANTHGEIAKLKAEKENSSSIKTEEIELDKSVERECKNVDNEEKQLNVQTNFNENEMEESNMLDNIHFKKVTIDMNIFSKERIEYIMKYEGIVNGDELKDFSKELNWSGSSYQKTELLHSNIEAYINDNIGARCIPPYMFEIEFEESLRKGETIKFSTKTILSDANKSMIPISAFLVKYPIDKLILTLTAPKGMVHRVRASGYKDMARQRKLYNNRPDNKFETGETFTYYHEIPNPTPWIHHCLEWDFSQDY